MFLKYLYSLSALLLTVTLPIHAQQRSYDEAVKIATNFFESQNNTSTVSALQQKATHARKLIKYSKKAASTSAAYYLFQNESTKQLIVVSGDERMQNILGYTDQALNQNTLPEGLTDLLSGYEAAYNALKRTSTTTKNTTKPNQSQSVTSSSTLKKTVQEKLLQTAEWGQGTPFNNQVPQGYPVGCAATAMAIVMQYHQWPEVGAGSKTHIWKDSVMTANFGQTHYDWANMPSNYNNGYTEAQARAVSQLMRHAGISVEMYYAAESSGARQTLVPGALSQYFRYAQTARLLNAADYDATTWHQLLRDEIDANRPVIYTGESTLGRGAHGFVLDGYRDNLFHFNFGWNGSGNGYFAVSALNSISSSFEFANKQQAVLGITPLKEENCAPLSLDIPNAYEGFYTPLTTLKANESVSLHLSNLTALRTWKGQLAWALRRADGTQIELLAPQTMQINGGGAQSIDFTLQSTHTAQSGDYLQLMACEDTATTWRPVLNAKRQEVVLSAFNRQPPVVHVVQALKHAHLATNLNSNNSYEGQPLMGAPYTFTPQFDAELKKTLVQTRLSGEVWQQVTEGASITVIPTTDTLYIKAKGYTTADIIESSTLHVDQAGKLQSTMNAQVADPDAIESLTITGSLSSEDISYLSTLQSLQQLNLENTTVNEGLFGAPFAGFSRLTVCTLPRSLKALGSEAFKNCASLTSISLPVSLQATGADLFSGCEALTHLYVHPSSPTCVSAEAFNKLPHPDRVTIHVQQGLIDAYQSQSPWSIFTHFVDDLAALPRSFTADGIHYKAIYQGDGNYAQVTIPEGEMYHDAITIPATVSYQGIDYVVNGFDNTDGLSPFVGNPFITSLTLNLQVDTLRARLFMGCTNLSTLQLPTTLCYIDTECFRNCPMLQQITLPATVQALGDNAFCGCQYLSDIYCYAPTPPSGSNTDNYPFAQCRPQNVTLHVPASCESLYRTSGFWSRFSNIVADLPMVETGVVQVHSSAANSFPIKVVGKQWITLHLDCSQNITLHRFDGTLLRKISLPQGTHRIWVEDACVLSGK